MRKVKELPIPTFTRIGVSEKSDGKIVILRLNIEPEEWVKQSEAVKKILYISEAEKEEVYRYLNMDEMTKKIIEAFMIANNALYFNNSSDYASALWEICSLLNPGVYKDEEADKLLFIDTSQF